MNFRKTLMCFGDDIIKTQKPHVLFHIFNSYTFHYKKKEKKKVFYIWQINS